MKRLFSLTGTLIIAILTDKAFRRKLIRTATGLMIAMFMDIAIGLFSDYLLRKSTGHSPSWMVLRTNLSYLRGPLLALFPDLDAIAQYVSKKNMTAEHRSHLHTPLVAIGGWLVFFAFLSLFWAPARWWALLSTLCLVGHFLHDSIGSGGGVRWLWPFSNEYYQLFSIKERKVFSVWNPNGWEYYTLQDWLEGLFLKPTVESISGAAALVIAIALILFC